MAPLRMPTLLAICLIAVALLAACGAAEEDDFPPRFLGGERTRDVSFPLYGAEARRDETGAILSASPSLIQSGEAVTVAWSNVTSATDRDWVAMFCPGDLGSDEDYLDYLYASGDASGAVTFPNLINMRCQYRFRYYRGSKESGRYPLVATSGDVTFFGGDNVPMQLHLALTGAADQSSGTQEMLVSWTSGSAEQDSQVRYGVSPDDLDLLASSPAASSRTYAADDMCGSPANVTSQQLFRNPGYMHAVRLSGLSPNTTYFYQAGNDVDGWSKPSWFLSPYSEPAAGEERDRSEHKSVTFAVYGDMGVNSPPGAVSTIQRCMDRLPGLAFVLHIGDISYARAYAYIWEQFFAIIEPLARHVPYMISIGNHEYDHSTGGQNDPSGAPGNGFRPKWGNYGDDSSGECSVPMYNRFTMPDNGNGIYWYSFDYGPVHNIMLSTEHNYTRGSPQYKWLEEDLQAVDRSVTPFVVLTGHRAMYCSEGYWSDWEVSLGMRYAFESLLDTYNVDIAFWGHYHAYERTCQVVKGKCTTDGSGTVHIVVGTAGAHLDNPDTKVDRPWSVAYVLDWGISIVTATHAELLMQFISNSDGSVADEVLLKSRYPS